MPFWRGAGSLTDFETIVTLGGGEHCIEATAIPVDGSETQGPSDH